MWFSENCILAIRLLLTCSLLLTFIFIYGMDNCCSRHKYCALAFAQNPNKHQFEISQRLVTKFVILFCLFRAINTHGDFQWNPFIFIHTSRSLSSISDHHCAMLSIHFSPLCVLECAYRDFQLKAWQAATADQQIRLMKCIIDSIDAFLMCELPFITATLLAGCVWALYHSWKSS